MPLFLVDDQGLEADLRSQKRGFFKEKTAKIARFESHAPIMPQNAPVKPGYITCCLWLFISTLLFDLTKKELLKYKQSIDKNKNIC